MSGGPQRRRLARLAQVKRTRTEKTAELLKKYARHDTSTWQGRCKELAHMLREAHDAVREDVRRAMDAVEDDDDQPEPVVFKDDGDTSLEKK
jgi:hypothetical protein